MNIRTLLKIAILSSFIITFNACGDDEVTGCTDVNADNYDPLATVSGDCNYKGCTDPDAENYDANANVEGDCIYARDKFLGSYLGRLDCTGDLEMLSNDSVVFTIIEGLDADIKGDIILELTVEGLPLPIAGQVDGDVLSLMQELKNVTVPTPIGDQMGDVNADGMAMMTNNDNTLDGTLDLKVSFGGGLLMLTDNCTIVGEKQ